MSLLIVIHDLPCPGQLKADVKDQHREYLTRDMMKQLKLSLFWKHGVELRPAENIKGGYSAVKRVEPYAKELAKSCRNVSSGLTNWRFPARACR